MLAGGRGGGGPADMGALSIGLMNAEGGGGGFDVGGGSRSSIIGGGGGAFSAATVKNTVCS